MKSVESIVQEYPPVPACMLAWCRPPGPGEPPKYPFSRPYDPSVVWHRQNGYWVAPRAAEAQIYPNPPRTVCFKEVARAPSYIVRDVPCLKHLLTILLPTSDDW
jgi:hypothetical protein